MHLSSRFAAGITGTFLAAMIVATSGFVNAGAFGGEMAGMGSIGAASHATPGVGVLGAELSKSGQAPCNNPCGQEGCRSMVGCAAAAVVPAYAAMRQPGPVSALVVASAMLEPESESPAPELPPPRA